MQFKRIRRRKRRKREQPWIKAHAIHVLHRRHCPHIINDFLRVLLASGLQVGIHQKIQRMELMSLAPHVHGRFFSRSSDGCNVGINIVLPQTEPRKNMRRHVQRMRGPRRKLRIFAGRGQSLLGHVGFIVSVDQIVRDSRMVRLLGKKLLQNCGSFLSILVRFVAIWFSRQQTQRIECRRFVIIRITLVNLFHGL